jgi:hypothetical protein
MIPFSKSNLSLFMYWFLGCISLPIFTVACLLPHYWTKTNQKKTLTLSILLILPVLFVSPFSPKYKKRKESKKKQSLEMHMQSQPNNIALAINKAKMD